MRGLLFSFVHLLLCETNDRRLFLRFLWPLGEHFLFPKMWLGSGGNSAVLRSVSCDLSVTCVPSSLSFCRMMENGCSSSGDVWMALSVTLFGLCLPECAETKVLSCFRASSSVFRSLSCSSVRLFRLVFKLCRFEQSSAVPSPR